MAPVRKSKPSMAAINFPRFNFAVSEKCANAIFCHSAVSGRCGSPEAYKQLTNLRQSIHNEVYLLTDKVSHKYRFTTSRD